MESRFVETGDEGNGARLRVVELAPRLAEALERTGLPPSALAAKSFGTKVTDHRSSWVRRGAVAAIEVFAKTYDYPTLRDRLRGAFRTTWLRPGRARREAAALRLLQAEGLPGPAPLAVLEWREFGWLRRAVLVTEAWPAPSIAELYGRLDPAGRRALAAAARSFAQRLHAFGFVDRNLDPRNLLAAQRDDGSFRIAKIDSPRFQRLPPGRRLNRLAALDRARLERGLRDLDRVAP
ncbi:MAG: lipopolysaccharide kinase InaA family protein [Planctomycetota bacterium]